MSATKSDWTTATLESIADRVDYGHTASAVDYAIGPKFLRITDIQNGHVQWKDVPYCRTTQQELEQYRLGCGDIVFARTGATTGKSFLISECPGDAVFASYLIRVRPGRSVDPRYLSFFFGTPDYWSQIKRHAKGAGQPGVNASSLKSLAVPLPPLSEQKRIADILDKADAIRRKRREALAQIEQLATSAYRHRFGNPIEANDSVPLGKCVTIISGGTPSKSNPDYWNGHFPWVSPKDMKVDFIADAEDHVADLAFRDTTLKKLPAGTILIVVRGMILAHTVPVAITETPVAINQDMRALVPHKGYNPHFICWSLKSAHNFILGKVATAAHGTKRLEVEHITSFPIPRTPLSAQKEFAAAVQRIRAAQGRLGASEPDDLFNSLVQRAFQGRL